MAGAVLTVVFIVGMTVIVLVTLRYSRHPMVIDSIWPGRRQRFGLVDDCQHANRVPVDLALTGEVIAQLCTDCWEQLPKPPKPPRGPSGISPSADGSR